MERFPFFLIGLGLFFWVGLIFFDGVKSSETIQIYTQEMHGVDTSQAKITDLENELASAYETHNTQVKIDNRYVIDDKNVGFFPQVSAQENSKRYKENVIDMNHPQISTHTQEPSEKLPQFPTKYNLSNVPFYSQAPDGNWKEPYQNACEEASILLAYYYIVGKNPTKNEYKKDLLNLMAWEQNNLGHHKDTTIDEFLYLIKNFLNINKSFLVINPSVEDIKRELAKGNIIIAPFRGKELNNPHYSLGGPEYHVMVIKGYDKKYFITEDVGTVRGKDRKYTIETIMFAMSNGNKKELDISGSKIIVLEK